MIHVEQYKLFHNSKDFENIYKIAQYEFQFSEIEYIKFIEKYLKICIQKQSILLLYEKNIVIGFYMIDIEKRIGKIIFAYIHPQYRGKKYIYFLLDAAIIKYRTEYDFLITYIHHKNIASLKSVYKIIEKFNFNFKKENIVNEKGQSLYKFILQEFK